MNASMRRVIGVVTVVVLTAMACGDARPCSNCPQVAGRYRLAFANDAGVLTGCASAPQAPSPFELELQQSGSVVRAFIEGVEYRGTLLDTYDFSLQASATDTDGGLSTERVRARFIEGAPDAGDGLRGTWVSARATGASTCELERPFTGRRETR